MIGEIEANCVLSSDLASRIDAEYYQQLYIEAQSRLNTVHCVPFHTLWKDSYRIYMGIKGYEEVADSDGYTPYLRPVNIDDFGFVNLEQLGWCESGWLKDYGDQGTAKPNDLIVEVKGNTRKVAVLPTRVPENCVVSGSAWRIQINNKADTRFIQAYLLSEIGQILKRREISNSIIPWINPEAFKHLSIPLPDFKIQAYIGDKVRLAEKCREEAINLWEGAKQILADSLGLSLSSDTYQSYDLKDLQYNFYQAISKTPVICWVHPNIIDDRIGPQFFHPRRENVIQKLQGACEVKKLSDLATRVTKRISAEKAAHLGYVGLSEIDSTNGFFEPISMGQAETVGVSSYFESRDVLFSKLRPYLNKVTICPDFLKEACGSTELLVYRAKRSVHPFYLFFVLKSNLGLYQIIDLTAGSTLPRVDSGIIDDLLIPLISEDMQGEIERKICMAFNLLHSARDLIHQSQSDIEALIEKRLPVDQIVFGKLCAPTIDDIYNQLQ